MYQKLKTMALTKDTKVSRDVGHNFLDIFVSTDAQSNKNNTSNKVSNSKSNRNKILSKRVSMARLPDISTIAARSVKRDIPVKQSTCSSTVDAIGSCHL